MHFNRLYAVKSKLEHLAIAQELGLVIPPTLISNNPREVRRFFKISTLDNIVKPYGVSYIPEIINGEKGSAILANKFSVDDGLKFTDEQIKASPLIYQKYIDKKYELRVFSTQTDTVYYKVDSQNSRLGGVDWRRAQYENIYEEYEMQDVEFSQILQSFLKCCDLDYGVFDVIRSLTGELIFVECNPDGQWAWLESRCGNTKVTEAIVAMIKVMGDV